MKKTMFAFAVIGSMFLVSCGGAEEDNNQEGTEQQDDKAAAPSIVGTWQQTGMDMGMEIPEDQKEMYEKTINETVKNTQYTFGEDKSFKVKSMMLGKVINYEGTYSIEGDELTTTEEGEDTKFKFTVSESELVISQEDRGATIKLTFKRQ